MEPMTFRFVCGVISVVLLALIVMRRKNTTVE